MSLTLTDPSYHKTDGILQTGKSMWYIAKYQGIPKAAFTAGLLTATTLSVTAISYFAMEGAVRSLALVPVTKDNLIRIRPFGNIGGWTSLSIFSIYGLGTIINNCIREGKYAALPSFLNEWLEKNKEAILEDPALSKQLQKEAIRLLDDYQAQCLFNKTLASRRITIANLFPNSPYADIKEDLITVNRELNHSTSPWFYFHRLASGQKALFKLSLRKHCGSLFLGGLLPLVLLMTTLLSIVGEVGLGKELFADRASLSETGHFGEWPFNALESITMAILLHIWVVLNEGDYVRKKNIYKKHLEKMQDNPETYKLFRKTANQELEELSGRRFFFRPSQRELL